MSLIDLRSRPNQVYFPLCQIWSFLYNLSDGSTRLHWFVASCIIRKMAAPDCTYNQWAPFWINQEDFNIFDLDPISQGHLKSMQFLVLVSWASVPSLNNVGQIIHQQSSTQVLRIHSLTDWLTDWLTHSLTHSLPFTGYKPTS